MGNYNNNVNIFLLGIFTRKGKRLKRKQQQFKKSMADQQESPHPSIYKPSWPLQELDEFHLIIMKNGLFVTLSFRSRVVRKQLVGAFKVDGSSWCLGHGVN